jgi:hypothetical protein
MSLYICELKHRIYSLAYYIKISELKLVKCKELIWLYIQVKTPEVSKDLTVLVPGQMTPIPPTQEQTGNRRKRKASVGEVSCINL